MTSKRDHAPSPSDEFREDWPRVLSFASLFGAVLGALLIGAALRTDAPPAAVPEPTPAPLPAGQPAPQPPAPVESRPQRPPVEPLDPVPVDRLAERIGSDLERMASEQSGWTAQVAVLCEPARVERMIERFGSLSGFHVLPAFLDEKPCFRVCWNRYPTRESAKAAADLPAALREIAARPVAKSIPEVIE